MKRKRRLKKVTKGLISVSVLLVCMGAAVAITLALLTAKTTPKPNTFTGTAGLKVDLHEPLWDDNPTTPDDNTDGGNKKAENYSPNLVIPKDPYLQNTTKVNAAHTEDSDEYVALRLTYQINTNQTGSGDPVWETITYEQFQQLAKVYHGASPTDGFNVGGEDAQWTANDNNTVFYYNSILPAGEASASNNQTSKLFDNITINNLDENTPITCPEGDSHTHKGLIQFRIVVRGFAVQAYEKGEDIGNSGKLSTTVKNRLDTLMGNVNEDINAIP